MDQSLWYSASKEKRSSRILTTFITAIVFLLGPTIYLLVSENAKPYCILATVYSVVWPVIVHNILSEKSFKYSVFSLPSKLWKQIDFGCITYCLKKDWTIYFLTCTCYITRIPFICVYIGLGFFGYTALICPDQNGKMSIPEDKACEVFVIFIASVNFIIAILVFLLGYYGHHVTHLGNSGVDATKFSPEANVVWFIFFGFVLPLYIIFVYVILHISCLEDSRKRFGLFSFMIFGDESLN